MFFRLNLKVALVALFMCVAFPALSQVAPAASESGLPLSVGAGVSIWDVDWGHNKMEGSTLWIDYQPNRTPYFLRGFGLEVEARDISWNRGDKPNNFRQDTASGGVIYTWQHYRKFHPYGKFMAGLASEDFRVSGFPNYTHDTRTFIAPGLGAEYRVLGHLWVRADYQYQFWQVLLTGRPDPQGFTFGVMYDFRHPNR